jgi:hypothetical protein
MLKCASASRPSGEWNDDDFDVHTDGAVIGRIMKVHATCRLALDVDARFRARGPHSDARLRGDARGRDGGVREKLAAGGVLRSGGRSASGAKRTTFAHFETYRF